jgi:alanine racemase
MNRLGINILNINEENIEENIEENNDENNDENNENNLKNNEENDFKKNNLKNNKKEKKIKEIIKIIKKMKNIKVELISTHFSVADDLEETKFTKNQLNQLIKIHKIFLDFEINPKISFSNSPCLIFQEFIFDENIIKSLKNLKISYRIGHSLYVFFPLIKGLSINDKIPDGLLPVGESYVTRIHQINYLKKNDFVSYGNTPIFNDGYYATLPMYFIFNLKWLW